MQSIINKVIIASAGSGKTTFLVKQSLSQPSKKIAILTYTNNNIKEIKKKFREMNGGVPKRIDVFTWFAFLLHECARPYQRSVYSKRRVKTINFPQGRSPSFVSYADTERYYFRNGDEIYSDKLSRFVKDCEGKSQGLVTRRLAEIYDHIYIDEFQDLAGYDLDLLEVFLRTSIRMIIVGDPRQCTYTTNNSSRNGQYRGMGILNLVRKWEASSLCKMETHARSYRCNQKICDFADRLWPGMDRTVSKNLGATGHDGIFLVSEANLHEYIKAFAPEVLRYNRRTETHGYPASNFGNVKGLGFPRVLIIPHGPIRNYLMRGDVNDVEGSLEKFYVAVTRAQHSVAFLHDGECRAGCVEWQPSYPPEAG